MIQEINWFSEIFLSTEIWGWFGPMILVIVGYYLAEKSIVLGVLMFLLDCLTISYYATLVDATPAYIWHIFILVIGGLLTLVIPLWNQK